MICNRGLSKGKNGVTPICSIAYHAMQMYATKLQPNVLPVTIESDMLSKGEQSVPVVDAFLTCSKDKKQLAIALVNKDTVER